MSSARSKLEVCSVERSPPFPFNDFLLTAERRKNSAPLYSIRKHRCVAYYASSYRRGEVSPCQETSETASGRTRPQPRPTTRTYCRFPGSRNPATASVKREAYACIITPHLRRSDSPSNSIEFSSFLRSDAGQFNTSLIGPLYPSASKVD